MKNEIWRLHYRTVRCHTHDSKLMTRLFRLSGAQLANVYFWHERKTAWDIDVPTDKVKYAESILGVKCDNSTACQEVRFDEIAGVGGVSALKRACC